MQIYGKICAVKARSREGTHLQARINPLHFHLAVNIADMRICCHFGRSQAVDAGSEVHLGRGEKHS